jgi:hypothetical protein
VYGAAQRVAQGLARSRSRGQDDHFRTQCGFHSVGLMAVKGGKAHACPATLRRVSSSAATRRSAKPAPAVCATRHLRMKRGSSRRIESREPEPWAFVTQVASAPCRDPDCLAQSERECFGARFARPKNIRKDPLRLSAKPILVFQQLIIR